ncbi:MAG: hypothetical protein IKB86_06775 [Clostridia bacterium]|nr:hypothetical protein [Clostridia bacterium]
MRDKLIKFMYGRYGVDELGKVMLGCALVLSVVSMIFNLFWPLGSVICSSVSFAFMFLIIFRAFSKNINRRVMENHKYLARTEKLRGKLKFYRTMFNERKNYAYIKCPNCKNYSRVPKGKGKIKITCRVCKKQFEKKV